MGTRLNIRSEEFLPAENQEWLGSAHGTQEMESVTLDHTAFGDFDGLVPSGVVLARAADNKVVPYDGAGAGAVATAIGHLFTTTVVPTDADTTGSLYWHGRVRVSKLPANSGYDAGVAADLPQIRYVTA
jgi:hypothetical protein